MGLIHAALASASNVLSEQWKDYFYCDALPNDVLAVRGRKRTGNHGNIQVMYGCPVLPVKKQNSLPI